MRGRGDGGTGACEEEDCRTFHTAHTLPRLVRVRALLPLPPPAAGLPLSSVSATRDGYPTGVPALWTVPSVSASVRMQIIRVRGGAQEGLELPSRPPESCEYVPFVFWDGSRWIRLGCRGTVALGTARPWLSRELTNSNVFVQPSVPNTDSTPAGAFHCPLLRSSSFLGGTEMRYRIKGVSAVGLVTYA
jgi:hypothetical protein